MSIDFQSVFNQIRALGLQAPAQKQIHEQRLENARRLLAEYANELQSLREKVERVVHSHDASLRCAVPVEQALNSHLRAPDLSDQVTLLAADGSQIYPDRHALLEYYLINIGIIQSATGTIEAPQPRIKTELIYNDLTGEMQGFFNEDRVSLHRDLLERKLLAEEAAQLSGPVIALTDGPLELWGASKIEQSDPTGNEKGLSEYLQSLLNLQHMGIVAAGYVDKPREDYLVRLLEIASQPVEQAKNRLLHGVRDTRLLRDFLAPGERSAVFEMQSRSASLYRQHDPALTMHFFYLNVGRPNKPWFARVDILGGTAKDENKVDTLHRILLEQCAILGSQPYPYLLHRAHETAVVSFDERNQVEILISNELRQHGLIDEESHKQSAKNQSRRGR